MNWINNATCCHVAIVLAIISGIETALFLGYTVKISRQQVSLERLEKEHQLRIKELEKKNGSELTKIEELEKQIQALKRAI
jgi:Tfp pilus assembly protein PilO